MGAVAFFSGLNVCYVVCRLPELMQKVRWCALLLTAARLPLVCWCPPHGHPLVSHRVTERYLWSFGPLMSRFSSGALRSSPLVHACNSSGGGFEGKEEFAWASDFWPPTQNFIFASGSIVLVSFG